METASHSLLEGISHSLWLMSGILSRLKQTRFNPPESSLFITNISSLSASLSSQARSAAHLADYLRSKRRESYVAHATLPFSQAQKHELLVSPGSTSGASWRRSPARLRRIPSSFPLYPWLRSPSLVHFVDVSPHLHRPVRQTPLLKLDLRVISLLFFNVPPHTSAPPLWAEVVVLSALEGGQW